MASTAIGAAGEDARTITFMSKEHKEFYLEYLPKCRWKDVYHEALVYCLGIDRDTRKHVNKIYDFKNGSVKPECLQEGGGKTTTTINLGVGLAKEGKKVVLVDADPQGHLTMGLGFPKNLRVTLKTMMENIIMGLEFDPKEAVLHHAEGIDVIPSNKLLSGMDMSLFTVEDREKVLKEYLELLEQEYDYILIDCMPSLGMLTINALTAADSVLIPVQPQYYAADGLMELLKVVKGIHQRFNPALQIEGILFTMDSCHYNNSKRNKQAVRDAYGAEIKIFDQTIPRTETLAETASEGVSIFSYDAKSKGAYSYQILAQEVLNHA